MQRLLEKTNSLLTKIIETSINNIKSDIVSVWDESGISKLRNDFNTLKDQTVTKICKISRFLKKIEGS